MVNVLKQKQRNGDAKVDVDDCQLVGLDIDTKGYRVYDPEQRRYPGGGNQKQHAKQTTKKR